MNEEQTVLDFFAQSENLPLTLGVADQADTLRRQLNNDFWRDLLERIAVSAPEWRVAITEDRNAAECLVGLHLSPSENQALYLRPMMEQQYLGDTVRIYYGLMWSNSPTPQQTRLPAITALRDILIAAGYKSNESFLAWQWAPYYPRRKDFLLRFYNAADTLLNEVNSLMQALLSTHGEALHAANKDLRDSPRSVAVSLDKLRTNLK